MDAIANAAAGMTINGKADGVVTADARPARRAGRARTVELGEVELAKRIRAQKAAKRRAENRAVERLGSENLAYQSMVHEVAGAIRSAEVASGKWASMGPIIVAFYGGGQRGADAFIEDRERFTIDAIVAGLPDAERALMHATLPRAGSKEAAGLYELETKRKRKDDIARKVSLYWRRIVGYAYPKDKPATDDSPEGVARRKVAQFQASLATMLKQVQGSDSLPDVDMPGLVADLKAALTRFK